MLQRNNSETKFHGFVVGIELEEGVEIRHVLDKLHDSVAWVEGTGEVIVDYIGEVEENEE